MKETSPFNFLVNHIVSKEGEDLKNETNFKWHNYYDYYSIFPNNSGVVELGFGHE
jgi:hypothetical protein